jgi:hypothetical protein
MTDKATPRPWQVSEVPTLIEAGPMMVAKCHLAPASLTLDPHGEANANAALIVRAVNAHDGLVEALQEILDYRGGADNALQDEYVVERAEAALRAAGVEP